MWGLIMEVKLERISQQPRENPGFGGKDKKEQKSEFQRVSETTNKLNWRKYRLYAYILLFWEFGYKQKKIDQSRCGA